MKMLKSIGLTLMVFCAFSAVSASARAAVHWNVSGSALPAGQEEILGISVNIEAMPTITVPNYFRITCSTLEINNGRIIGTYTSKADSWKLTGCSMQNKTGESLAKCAVKSSGGTNGTIVTSSTNAALKSVESHAYDIVSPPAEKPLATLEVSANGGSCAVSGSYTLTGDLAYEATTGTNAAELFFASSESIQKTASVTRPLMLGLRQAYLDFRGYWRLASGKTWGVGL